MATGADRSEIPPIRDCSWSRGWGSFTSSSWHSCRGRREEHQWRRARQRYDCCNLRTWSWWLAHCWWKLWCMFPIHALCSSSWYQKRFELAPANPSMDHRLDKIESMLYRLAENQTSQPRASDLTYVESPNRSTSKFAEDLRLNPASEERIRSSVGGNRVEPVTRTEHRTAGLPKAELGRPEWLHSRLGNH